VVGSKISRQLFHQFGRSAGAMQPSGAKSPVGPLRRFQAAVLASAVRGKADVPRTLSRWRLAPFTTFREGAGRSVMNSGRAGTSRQLRMRCSSRQHAELRWATWRMLEPSSSPSAKLSETTGRSCLGIELNLPSTSRCDVGRPLPARRPRSFPTTGRSLPFPGNARAVSA
jgi:hypothetical protein